MGAMECGKIVLHPFTGHPYICTAKHGHAGGHEEHIRGFIGPVKVLDIYATDTTTGKCVRLGPDT